MSNPELAPLRVLLTSTSYPSSEGDWRGVFMRHLVSALARRNDVALSIWAPPGPLPAEITSIATAGETAMLTQLMTEGGVSHLLRNHRVRGALAALRLLAALRRAYRAGSPEVYHVNWLQCLLPLPTNGVPLLVTVLGNDMRLLRIPGMVKIVRRAMRGRRVTISPNSEWMQPHLQTLFGDIAAVHPVPFGIEPHWYALARKPSSNASWLLVTRLTKRKLGPIFTWGHSLFGPGTGRVLHVLGPMQEPIDLPEWIQYHGPATPTDLREHWFPMATGLLSLSEHDEGRPQVMLEAMASGLPVVASRLSAHVDLIRDGIDGMIVDTPDAFAHAIIRTEDPALNSALSAAARERMRELFGTWDDCAARYASHYRRMIEEQTGD
ncbi:glycosyltransferase family 4 protein [Luteibacter aegosomaticola]|uniref:glycosyltransferase family 4 protein n=1 Tax=Luteibacter aegosomaticola TaxID=2911538 RepID=UPI001FF97EBC|nr:glycosyltransferase family 4 protein [Luteibacter aegosomaticola]UPG91440.1 glycosyltransferase family 4 protein [Luteibacter aegosomaticola]